MQNNRVSSSYLQHRDAVLQYTYQDMNLKLENDQQVYIAVFDVPVESIIVGSQTQTYAMLFGLNTHIYFGSGDVLTGLEKKKPVMEAMQSMLISSHQVLKTMELISNCDYYESKNIRAYLKTKQGVFFKEITGETKEDRFLLMLFNKLRKAIAETM